MKKLLCVCLFVFCGVAAHAQIPNLPQGVHHETATPENARFQVVSAQTAAKWTFRLDRYTGQIARQPKRLGFNPDVFRWLVEEAAAGQDDCEISLNAADPRGYLPVVWTGAEGEGKVFLGFEPGDNWRRWRAILRDARETTRKRATKDKAVFFRTAEQPPLPGPRWSIAAELREARRGFLDVIELDAAETAELYAARNLYLDAVAGDLPYAPAEVQAFLAGDLEPLWQRIRREPAA